MPLYAYVCTGCKHEFALLRPMSQATQNATCPACQGKGARVLSVFTAFTSNNGESAPVAGAGGCACAAGGACACARR